MDWEWMKMIGFVNSEEFFYDVDFEKFFDDFE